MKTKKFIILSLFLVLLFSISGAVSATDIDNTTTVDTTVSDISVSDIQVTETEQIEETEVNNLESGNTVTANSWSTLENYCKSENNQVIRLTDNEYNANKKITFKNSATIIGSPNSYITGNLSDTIFISSRKSITFINVTFKNIDCNILMQLSTTGTNTLNGCVFDNITTGTGRTSVVYNNGGFMNIINSNFTNCNTPYGTISNYNALGVDKVSMNVTNCRFENNSASTEPGAINNCGLLNVTNSAFINNNAVWWAGAIHTHTNAYTRINNSNFTSNTAGWNGGALFTYSKLEVYNSIFEDNNCSTDNGGGAIGAYNYGSSYNITIENCTFNSNNNLASNGRGGAISVLNGGYLDVHSSTFNNNNAEIGQAICAYTATYENATGGTPKVKIYNNTFTNHNGTNDTVYLTGNDYTFENNTFINSQQTQYNESNIYSIETTPNTIDSITSLGELGDVWDCRDVIYLNPEHSDDLDGTSWETAIGGDEFLIANACYEVRNNGTIYLAGTVFNMLSNNSMLKNLTFIGQEGTVLTKRFTHYLEGSGEPSYVYTYMNIIFDFTEYSHPCFTNEFPVRLINCTIIGLDIDEDDPDWIERTWFGLENEDDRQIEEQDLAYTYRYSFENCTIKDSNVNYPLIQARKYSHLNFENCIFENITALSLIESITDGGRNDGVVIKNCTFKDCNFANGLVDYIAQTEDLITIEDCTYDFEATTDVVSADGHYYVNATKLKVTTVDTNIAIGEYANNTIVITLTDVEGNPITNTEIKYTLNGEEATGITNDEGKVNVPVNIIGDVTLTTQFIGNEAYNPSEANKTFNVPKVKTTLTVSSMTKYYGSSKKLSVTLKDENGNALVGETVTITINGKNYTGKTNSNGVASFAINNAKGTYKVNVNYAGTTTYDAVSKDITVKVVKPIMKAVSTKVKKGKYFQVSIKTYNKKAIKNTVISIKYNKKVYNVKTNTKGIAKLKLNKKGKFTIVSKFKSTTTYGKTTLTTKVKVY